MPKVKANGIDIHCQQVGHGPDIVLVHGLAANLAFWYLRIVPLLAEDYRVTVFDLRGHGSSGMPPDGYTTRQMADDLMGLLDGLHLESVHLGGHSLGGAVCLHCAVLHPERVQSLALFDCRIHALQPLRDPEDTTYWSQRRRKLQERGIAIPDNTPKVVYMMLDELASLTKSGQARPGSNGGLLLSNGAWDPKSRAAKRWNKLVTTTTFAKDIRSTAGLTKGVIQGVGHPTLLSYGGCSYCLDTCRELEAALINHKTVIHPEMGHFFPVSAPQLVAEDLRAFLSSSGDRNDACWDRLSAGPLVGPSKERTGKVDASSCDPGKRRSVP